MSASVTAKNLPKIGKKGAKFGKKREKLKNRERGEKSGRKGKNWESSFTFPLLTERASFPTGRPLLIHDSGTDKPIFVEIEKYKRSFTYIRASVYTYVV